MASICTAWGWGKYKEGTGWSAVRLKVEGADGRLVGLCSVAIRRKLGVRVFHVQGGPLLMNDDDELGARVLMAIVGHLAPPQLPVLRPDRDQLLVVGDLGGEEGHGGLSMTKFE